MKKKLLLGFTLILFLAGLSWAQYVDQRPVMSTQYWWYTLEKGKQYFRGGSYGAALNAFEDARRQRLDWYSRMEQDFILFLSGPEARSVGDYLDVLEILISVRHETRAAEILSDIYHRVSKVSLNGSVKRVLEELDRQKSYPEAEYWLGEVYQAEGEFSLALRQYEMALKERAQMENPDFDVEILFKIANIHRIRRDYQEMERRAKEIIEGKDSSGNFRDNLWDVDISSSSPSPNQMRSAMLRILENDGVNRFLTVYRYNNTVTEKAHRLLGFFYYSSNRYITATEHLMFAFLIQNTVLIEEVIRREYDFTFSSLDNLMDFIGTKQEIAAFLEETEYFKTAYYLASALYASGRTRPGAQLWAFLARSNMAGEWGARARRTATP